MGINFGEMNSTPASTAPIQEVPLSNGTITLDLTKSAVLDLTKRNPGLSNIVVACGWDTAVSGAAIDLDVSAFMLNSAGKITGGSDVVFFGNQEANGVKLNGDNRTGEGEGDDETMDVALKNVPSNYDSIVFAVNIYDAKNRRQTFGMVNNSYIRILDKDNNNKEICRYRLKDEASSSTAVIFAKLKRNGSEWDFETIGEGKLVDDLNGIAALYS